MPYRIHHIDVTAPLAPLTVGSAEDGFALVLRYSDRLIGFVMQPAGPGTCVAPAALSRLINDAIGTRILQELLADRLRPAASSVREPVIAAVVCTKDRAALLDRCLASLTGLPQWGDGNRDFKILVVDNAPSDDSTCTVVAGYPGVQYRLEEKPGLDFARNRAIECADADLIAYVDDDAVVDHGWLAGLREAWQENPDAGAFTGLVLPLELATEAQILFELRGGFRRGFQKLRFGSSHPANPTYPCGAGSFGAGCNMAFKRSVLLEIGGFDEALDTGPPLPGGGDLDMFYRIVRAGYPLVYEPQYALYHEHRRQLGRLRHQYWTWGLGFMAFVAKSYRTDPPLRGRFRLLLAWWFKHRFKELWRAVSRQDAVPPMMAAAELLGGIVGIFGEYARSTRRIERIRRRCS